MKILLDLFLFVLELLVGDAEPCSVCTFVTTNNRQEEILKDKNQADGLVLLYTLFILRLNIREKNTTRQF